MKKLSAIILTVLAVLGLVSGCSDTAKVETRGAVSISDNDAVVTGFVHGFKEMPSSTGVYFGQDKDNMKKIITDTEPANKMNAQYLELEYDVNLDGEMMLEPNTTYYYYIYARFGSKEVAGEIKSFTTLAETAAADITVVSGEVKDITSSSATIYGTLSDFSEKPTEAGLYLGFSEDEMNKVIREKNPYAEYDLDVLNVWFNTSGDAKMTLLPETTYYYQVYARIGERETRGEIKTFTTAAEVKE